MDDERDRTAPTGPAAPGPNQKQPPKGPRVDPVDPVEEASYESFPASDPPSFTPTRAGTPKPEPDADSADDEARHPKASGHSGSGPKASGAG